MARVWMAGWCFAAGIAGIAATVCPAAAQLSGGPEARGQAAVDGPAMEAARAAFERLPEADQIAIQDALVWTGDLSGSADGAFGRRTFEAIQAYQRRTRQATTGTLDRPAITGLLAAATKARATAGFAILDDAATGIRIGIPGKLLTKRSANPSGGSRFQSPDGKVTLDTRALPGGVEDLREMYDRNLAIQSPGRSVTYRLGRPDMFVISGETQTGRFYTRYAEKDGAIRGFSIGYDKALAAAFDRTVVAIANSFVPFPTAATPPQRPPSVAGGGIAAPLSTARPPMGSWSGFAVSARRVVVPLAATEACPEPTVDGATARLVSTDRARGLALLEPATSHRVVPYRLAGHAAEGSGLVLFVSPGEGGRTVAAPAELLASGRLYAPLQEGAAGGIVIDGTGAIAGIVARIAGGTRAVAGLVPPASHAFSSAAELRAVIGSDLPQTGGPSGAPPGGLGPVAAALAPALARIGCGAARAP